MIVVDASVAVKWLWPEPGDSEAANYLEKGLRLYAPASIRVEVAGAALRRYRENKMDENEARSACGLWERIIRNEGIRLIPVDGLFDAAVAYAFLTRHSLADCLYLAAAQEQDMKLITADEKLYSRGQKVYKKIELLAVPSRH